MVEFNESIVRENVPSVPYDRISGMQFFFAFFLIYDKVSCNSSVLIEMTSFFIAMCVYRKIFSRK